jgi:hypothetical protein
MKFLRTIFTIGYLVFGGLMLYSISDLMLKNVWIDLFDIQKTTPLKLEFESKKENSTLISYNFEYNGSTYSGKRTLLTRIVKAKLPTDKEDVTISFNVIFPQVNYLDQLEMNDRTGKVGMFISGIFLILFLLIDIFVNKRKWLKIYGLKE